MSYTKGKLNCNINSSFLIADGVAVCQQPEKRADAEHIVLCWNSHEALLKALDQIAHRKFLVDCDVDERNQMVSVAKAAIAQAKE